MAGPKIRIKLRAYDHRMLDVAARDIVEHVTRTGAKVDCKRRNYNTVKNRVNDRDRIEMKKYCRWCRKHTLHRETR